MWHVPNTVASSGLVPLKTIGDGSCFFRAKSLLLFGTQECHIELRGRTIVELATRHFNHTEVKVDYRTFFRCCLRG